MTVHHERLTVRSERRTDTTDITARVRAAVTRSKVRDGLVVVSSLHTTAGIFVNENADPDVQRDIHARLATLVPKDADYRHAEGNADAHIKALITGNAVTLPIADGELVLGTWQGIYLADFDGPRERHATVTVSGE